MDNQPPADRQTFDVAISFARKERSMARKLYLMLHSFGFSVYFDEWCESETVGRSLGRELTGIYLSRCRLCIVLVSEAYLEGHWPQTEWNALSTRWAAEGGDFLMPISVDGSVFPEMKGEALVHQADGGSLSDICRVVVDKLEADKGFTLLSAMHRSCIFLASILFGISLLSVVYSNAGHWSVPAGFIVLGGVLLACSAGFYRAPYIISVVFGFIAVFLGVAGLQAGKEDIVRYYLMGIPFMVMGMRLSWLTFESIQLSSKADKNAVQQPRSHPFAFLNTYPEICIVGSKSDSMFTKVANLFRAFRFKVRRIAVGSGEIHWPSVDKCTVLLMQHRSLDRDLWGNETRRLEFLSWMKSINCKIAVATSDGSLIPDSRKDTGYLDTRQLGALRSVVFFVSAFSRNRLTYTFKTLRGIALLTAIFSFVYALYHTQMFLLVAHGHSIGHHVENANLSTACFFFLLGLVSTFIWRKLPYSPRLASVGIMLSALCVLVVCVLTIIRGTATTTQWPILVMATGCSCVCLIYSASLVFQMFTFSRVYKTAFKSSSHKVACSGKGGTICPDLFFTDGRGYMIEKSEGVQASKKTVKDPLFTPVVGRKGSKRTRFWNSHDGKKVRWLAYIPVGLVTTLITQLLMKLMAIVNLNSYDTVDESSGVFMTLVLVFCIFPLLGMLNTGVTIHIIEKMCPSPKEGLAGYLGFFLVFFAWSVETMLNVAHVPYVRKMVFVGNFILFVFCLLGFYLASFQPEDVEKMNRD